MVSTLQTTPTDLLQAPSEVSSPVGEVTFVSVRAAPVVQRSRPWSSTGWRMFYVSTGNNLQPGTCIMFFKKNFSLCRHLPRLSLFDYEVHRLTTAAWVYPASCGLKAYRHEDINSFTHGEHGAREEIPGKTNTALHENLTPWQHSNLSSTASNFYFNVRAGILNVVVFVCWSVVINRIYLYLWGSRRHKYEWIIVTTNNKNRFTFHILLFLFQAFYHKRKKKFLQSALNTTVASTRTVQRWRTKWKGTPSTDEACSNINLGRFSQQSVRMRVPRTESARSPLQT